MLLCCMALWFRKEAPNDHAPYNPLLEQKERVARYKSTYEEFSWINAARQQEASKKLQFLEGIVSGSYIDFLQLFYQKEELMGHEQFCMLHKKLIDYIQLSNFSSKEMLEVLSYALLLKEVEETKEYKKRAWMYEASLAKVLLMHDQILPKMQDFSGEQKKFLCLLLEGLQLQGFFDHYRESIAYQVEGDFALLEENTKYFDVSFLLSLCREANKYGGRATLPPPCG